MAQPQQEAVSQLSEGWVGAMAAPGDKEGKSCPSSSWKIKYR